MKISKNNHENSENSEKDFKKKSENINRNMTETEYYVGLDVGTDSVGYAAAYSDYSLCKFKGEPMWGSLLFEEAETAADRRGFRTARRRLDRRQQRVKLLSELFAEPISEIDPDFFIRIKGSYICRTENDEPFHIFESKKADKEYHIKYPTIHHLIYELMNSDDPHDVRLVYMACAWLVAHRGHFLSEVNKDQIDSVLDFEVVYNGLKEYFEENGYSAPWDMDDASIRMSLEKSLKGKNGVLKKSKSAEQALFGDSKAPKTACENFPFSCEGIIKLICGGKYSAKSLFENEEYAEVEQFSLGMEDDKLEQIYSEIGEDSELLRRLKAIYDWSVLVDILRGTKTVSEAKMHIYEAHNEDLKTLKYFVRKYIPNEYNNIFRSGKIKDNYVCYSGNIKSCNKADISKVNKTTKEEFSKFISGKIKNISPDSQDKDLYDDMTARLETRTFLPKQRDTDNRVIPYQLYWYELNLILTKAASYLPFISDTDKDGISVKDKILSVFEFRVPYFVGPLRRDNCKWAWIERKAEGKIYPWNFESMVDLDKSEKAFIDRMTNMCTYMPGENVLPKNSLCYSSFEVLNEINNIKINDRPIPVSVKQGIYNDLFMKKQRVTPENIKNYLLSNNYMEKEDNFSGLDVTVKSSLKPQHMFRRLIEKGALNNTQIERIIEQAAYSEDKRRFYNWLQREFCELNESDIKYISSLKLKNFGRFSKAFLHGIKGADKETGEEFTVMEALWNTNDNLMKLLSDRYTFKDNIDAERKAYYDAHPTDISKRLGEMYISNSVKRPIIRTLDILNDIVKVMGRAPGKIFIEMARDVSDSKKGDRKETRKQQLIGLYEKIDSVDVREMEKQLEAMGDRADNMLQSDSLFLYYTQLGKCMYTGAPIDVDRLKMDYDIDHIYPQSYVKDDSVINNKVLVLSKANYDKGDKYPISDTVRNKMKPYWDMLHNNKLISDEKYRRLTRSAQFTDDEKYNFINRQLVETRQSTKALAQLLQEKYPDAEIVYVKAGLTSDFRNEFEIVKSREANDLHHAKDAYLNIVTGNVYNSAFSKRWYSNDSRYSIKTKILFTHDVKCGNQTVWQGEKSLADVKRTVLKNNIHFTRYAFCRKGGLFDQMPVKKGDNLVPLKKDMPTDIYGGYNKATASFFALVKYTEGKKKDIMVMPVELLYSDRFISDASFAEEYAARTVSNIKGKSVTNVELLLNRRIIKVNTMFSFDGLRMCVTGKSSGGRQLIFMLMTPFITDYELEKYIKHLESFANKLAKNNSIIPDEEYDHISYENNLKLYNMYIKKFDSHPYNKRPANPKDVLLAGYDKFTELTIKDQVKLLINVQGLFGRANSADLSLIDGKGKTGVILLNSSISNWNYSDVRIIDSSASGLFEKKSENLLELL